MPRPDLASGLDELEFTNVDYADMVRDVRTYTFNLHLCSPPAADREVQDPLVRNLFQQLARRSTVMPLPAVRAQIPPRLHLSIMHRMTRLEETALLRLNKAALLGEVMVLRRMVTPVSRRLGLHRAVDVALAVAPRDVVDLVHAVATVALHVVMGVVVLRRNVLLSAQLHAHLTPGPSAK